MTSKALLLAVVGTLATVVSSSTADAQLVFRSQTQNLPGYQYQYSNFNRDLPARQCLEQDSFVRLEQDFDVRRYSFGESVKQVDGFRDLVAEQKGSALGETISTLAML